MMTDLQIAKVSVPTPFPVGPVNLYLVEGDVLTLIDAGPKTEEAFRALEHFLKEHGYHWTDIRQLVLTHPHLDHQGHLRRVAELSGAPVFVHADIEQRVTRHEEEWERGVPFFREFSAKAGVPADIASVIEHGHRFFKELNQSVETVRTLREGAIPVGTWDFMTRLRKATLRATTCCRTFLPMRYWSRPRRGKASGRGVFQFIFNLSFASGKWRLERFIRVTVKRLQVTRR
jgi:hypothetical protein